MAKMQIADGIVSSSADYSLYRGLSKIATVQDGEFRVLGDLIAENYVVSSSVTSLQYQSLSGSTIFGDSPDDTHQFTGSLFITGSEINLQGPGTPTLFVRNSAGSQNSTIHIGEVNTTAYGAEFKYEGNLGNLFIDNRYNHSTRPHIYFRMRVAGTPITAMTIDPAGQVGIGTTSPGNLLHLNPSSGAGLTISGSNTRFEMKDDSGYQRIEAGVSTNNSFASFIQMKSMDNVLTTQITAGGADSFISSGSFGIGTNAPADNVHVVVSGNDGIEIESTGGAPTLTFDVPSNEQARLTFKEADTTIGGITYESNGSPDHLIFKVGGSSNNVERFRITGDNQFSGSVLSTGSFGNLVVANKIVESDDSDTFIEFPSSANDTINLFTGGNSALRMDNSFISLDRNSKVTGYLEATTNIVSTGANAKISGSSTSTGSFGDGRFVGRVGIGTITPTVDLEVNSAAATTVKINAGNGEDAILQLYADRGDNNSDKWDLTANAGNSNILEFNNAGSSMLTLTPTGVISGSSTSTGSFAQVHAADYLQVGSEVDTTHAIHATGHVGMTGTLHLASSQGINWAHGDASIVEGGSSNYAIDFYNYDGSGNNLTMTLKGNHDVVFTGSKISGSVASTGSFGVLKLANYNQAYGTSELNTFFGINAGGATTISARNVAIGHNALAQEDVGDRSVAVGYFSLYTQNSDSNNEEAANTGVGYAAGYFNETGQNNTYIGFKSGFGTSGYSNSNNTAVGYNSLLVNRTGTENVAIGKDSMRDAITSDGTVAIGVESLYNVTSGDNNVGLGKQALYYVTTGANNVAVGLKALKDNTASNNVAVGTSALENNTTGEQNVAMGYEALLNATEIDQNTAIGFETLKAASGSAGALRGTALGFRALLSNTSGYANTAVGAQAGLVLTTGGNNTLVGMNAGDALNTASGSVFVGSGAGLSSTTGNQNIAIGFDAMGGTATTGDNNIAIGVSAGDALTSGGDNIAMGAGAGGAWTTPDGNIGIGSGAMGTETAGDQSVAIGHNALKVANVTGGGTVGNIAIGHEASVAITTAVRNTIIGAWSMQSNQTGAYNTGVGYNVMQNTSTVHSAVAMGYQAMWSAATSDAAGAIAIGTEALHDLTSGIGNVAIGYHALSKEDDGDYNTAVGYEALKVQTGVSGTVGNTAVGYQSAVATTTGVYNSTFGFESAKVLTIGRYNTALGWRSLYSDVAGEESVAVGYGALFTQDMGDSRVSSKNTAVGLAAGYTNVTGTANTWLGYQAGKGGAGSNSFNVGVGKDALLAITTGGSNVAIGNDSAVSITDGHNNVAIGNNALEAAVSVGYAVAIGNDAMVNGNATAAADGTIAIGASAGAALVSSEGTTAIGYRALANENDGDYSTAIGYDALFTQEGTTGNVYNTAVGYHAGRLISSAINNTIVGALALDANDIGNHITAIGQSALSATNGAKHGATAIGYKALHQNVPAATSDYSVGVGFESGDNQTTGYQNTFLGASTTGNDASAVNQTVIGYHAQGQADNSVTLGNDAVTAVYMGDDSGATVHAAGLSVQDTGNISTSTFISGITGDGFKIIDGGADGVSMEIDNIMVRNTLRTHIFQKDVVKATNGILYVSDSGVISGSNGSDTVTFLDSKSATFSDNTRLWYKDAREDDGTIISVQFDIDGSGTTAGGSTTYSVDNVQGSLGDVTGSLGSGGGTAVRISGGSILLDSSTPNSPFIDVLASSGSGVSSGTVTRMGNLDGITTPRFGALSGFGMWASGSAYFEGSINAIKGNVGGWGIGETAISSSGGIVDIDAGTKRITIRSDASTDRVYLGEIAGSSDYGLKIFDGNGTNAENLLVELGSNQNMIVGWDLVPGNLQSDNTDGSVRLSSVSQSLTIWTGSLNEAEPKLVLGKLPLHDGTVDSPYGLAVFDGDGVVSGSESSASVLITANKARLAGWELVPGRLKSGTVADINGNNASLALGTGATTATGTPTDGLFFVSASANPVFYVGASFSYVNNVLTAGGWQIAKEHISSSSGNAIISGSGVVSLGTGTHNYEQANRIYIDGPGNRMSIGTGFSYASDELVINDNATIGGWDITSTSIRSTNTTSNVTNTVNITSGASSFIQFKADDSSTKRRNVMKLSNATNSQETIFNYFPNTDNGFTKFVRTRLGSGVGQGIPDGSKTPSADGMSWAFDYNNGFGEPVSAAATRFPVSESLEITLASGSYASKDSGVTLRYMVRHAGSNNSIQADPTDEVMRMGKIKDTYGTFNASTSTARQFSYGISGSMATTASFGLIEGGMIKGNGSLITNLTSAAIDGVSNMANNRVITAVDGTTVNAEANLVFTGTKLGIGTDSPLNLLQIDGSGADGANGISIVRSDSSTAADNLLGGISFDSTDGNAPSSILQGSAYIAAYASEDHSTGDKGGYLTFGTAPDDQNDDTTSTERVRIHNGGTLEVLTGNISGSATSTGSFGRVDGENFRNKSGLFLGSTNADHEYSKITSTNHLFIGAGASSVQMQNNLIPDSDGSHDLGSSNRFWDKIFAKTSITGSSTSTGSFGHGHFANKLGVGTQSPQSKVDIVEVYPAGTSVQESLQLLIRGGEADLSPAGTSIGMGFGYGSENNYVKTGLVHEFIDVQGRGKLHLCTSNAAGADTIAKGDARLTINETGNVGIGTTSPDKDLHIHQGNSNSLFEAVTIRTNSTGEGLCLGINADNSSYIYNSAAGNEGLRLSGISSARDTGHVFISGSGDVGIGKTPSVALEVAGTISGSLINSSGDVVAFNASDERLKDNIEIIKEPIEKIQQLRGVEYQWNGLQNTYPSGSLDSGIIAQDVQKVLPQLVKERGDGYLGVRQERLVGLLVESIKDQQEQINELKLQIKEIKDGSS